MVFLRYLKNKVFVYLASRYLSYGIQFIVSLVIAAKLGPYYLGLYGFLTLIINYCAVISFGIPSSLNVLMVHNKRDEKRCGDFIGNSIWLYGILSILLAAVFIATRVLNIGINDSYPIDKYLLFVLIIAILNYVNSVFNTVLRIRNKVNQLSIVQSLNVFLNLIVVFWAKGENLIWALLLCNIISGLVTVIVTQRSRVLPAIRNVTIKTSYQRELLGKGLYLFFYNSCFSLILISIRSLISSNYEVEEFGAFTFSFSIANSVMLLLESLMAIIFPKIIDLLSSNDNAIVNATLDKMRRTYISSAHFLIYLAMILFPLLIYLMPKYSNALTSMNLIALAVLMNTNSCGYSALLIAKNKERTSAVLSLTALILNIFLSAIIIYVFRAKFSFVILATMFTYLYFSFVVVIAGKKAIGVNNVKETVRTFFPIRLLAPYIVALVISCFQLELLIWLPLVLYIILNMNDIIMMKNFAKKIVVNPNIIDV